MNERQAADYMVEGVPLYTCCQGVDDLGQPIDVEYHLVPPQTKSDARINREDAEEQMWLDRENARAPVSDMRLWEA